MNTNPAATEFDLDRENLSVDEKQDEEKASTVNEGSVFENKLQSRRKSIPNAVSN